MSKSRTTEYVELVYAKLKQMAPGQTLNVSNSQDPTLFIEAVKFIIDLRIINVEFNADYTIVKRLEE